MDNFNVLGQTCSSAKPFMTQRTFKGLLLFMNQPNVLIQMCFAIEPPITNLAAETLLVFVN